MVHLMLTELADDEVVASTALNDQKCPQSAGGFELLLPPLIDEKRKENVMFIYFCGA
jgi:hypothetical protein